MLGFLACFGVVFPYSCGGFFPLIEDRLHNQRLQRLNYFGVCKRCRVSEVGVKATEFPKQAPHDLAALRFGEPCSHTPGLVLFTPDILGLGMSLASR